MSDEGDSKVVRSKWARRLPISSVRFEGDLPDADAPPWVCLTAPGATVVVRRYEPKSRTCDLISADGRWLLESALVPRRSWGPDELLYACDLAVGDVHPGQCIVYAGHELWFPQRVVRVEIISEQWQRIWTLGDAETRDVWTSDADYLWDNGLASGWSYDEMSWPMWPEGPWWPMQSLPLSENVRRFVLHKFGIAGECPNCGAFGRPIIFGLALDLDPHVELGGCDMPLDPPDYACACGTRWSVTDQGEVAYPEESLLAGPEDRADSEDGEDAAASEDDGDKVLDLNYDTDDVYPYGEETEYFFQRIQGALYEDAGGPVWDDENTPEGDEIYIRYWGRDRHQADMEARWEEGSHLNSLGAPDAAP